MSEHTAPMTTPGPARPTPVSVSRVKVGHLVAGLIFLGLAGSWALRTSGVIDNVTVGWLLPAILVAAGVIGLLVMLAGGVRRNRADQQVAEQEVNRPTPDPDVRTHPSHEEDHR